MSADIKNVLITGASRGIGLATSHLLANKGYLVIGIARTPPQDQFPGKFYQCDLSDKKKTVEVIDQIAKSYEIYAIVNNVGIGIPQPLGSIDLEALYQVFDLNVRVAVQMVQGFIEQMKERRCGRIINISSRAIFGKKFRTSYAAAKMALVGCTRTWALELAEFNITSNSVAPGPIETELFREHHPVGGAEEKNVLSSLPIKRIGKPEEVAELIAFLISDMAGFITGQNICIDGGGSLCQT